MPRAVKGSHDEIVVRAVHQLQAWIGRDHRLYEIAGALEVSHGFLEGIFKATIGVDLTTYRTFIRLHRARELLACTALPIVEVARLTGFRHQAYFAKVFRDATSMTPTEYRTLIARQADPHSCPARTPRGCLLGRLGAEARLNLRGAAGSRCGLGAATAPVPAAAAPAAFEEPSADAVLAVAPAAARAGRRARG